MQKYMQPEWHLAALVASAAIAFVFSGEPIAAQGASFSAEADYPCCPAPAGTLSVRK